MSRQAIWGIAFEAASQRFQSSPLVGLPTAPSGSPAEYESLTPTLPASTALQSGEVSKHFGNNHNAYILPYLSSLYGEVVTLFSLKIWRIIAHN